MNHAQRIAELFAVGRLVASNVDTDWHGQVTQVRGMDDDTQVCVRWLSRSGKPASAATDWVPVTQLAAIVDHGLSELHYRLAGGRTYQLFDRNELVRSVGPEVAMAFDAHDGTRHKHGDPEHCRGWVEKAQANLRSLGGGFGNEMAESLVCVVGPIPLEDLNRVLSTTGYAKQMYDRLQLLVTSPDAGPREVAVDDPSDAESAPGCH